MKILVTGSAGQIGSFIVEELRNRHTVVGLDIQKCGITDVDEVTTKGDIRTMDDVEKAMKEVDQVVHCAAQVSVAASMKNPVDDASHNITGTINILEAASKSSVSRVIYFSSAAIYGEPQHLPIREDHPLRPLSPYGASKMAGEAYALAYGLSGALETFAIRPFNVYSKRQDSSNPYSGVITRFVDRIKRGESPIIFGDGNQTRDFIHVSDVVKMVDMIMKSRNPGGKAFNCCTGNAVKIKDLANTIMDLLGRRDLKIRYDDFIPGEIKESVGDNTLAYNELNFSPDVSINEGLQRLLS